jgi:serine protease
MRATSLPGVLLFPCLISLLSACGGGGGSSGSGVSPSPPVASSSRASSSSIAPPVFSVTTNVAGNGSIQPVSVDVIQGSSTRFTLAAGAGFEVVAVTGCSGVLNGLVYTTAAINQHCVVSVTFDALDNFLGGSVTGLTGSLQLRLTIDTQQEQLLVSGNGSFTFSRPLMAGDAYYVSIVAQPNGQQCELANEFGIAGDTSITDIKITCADLGATASISGRISPVAGIAVDTTLNDLAARYLDNSSPLTPQVIDNRVILHGFASTEATGGDSAYERFATRTNEDDYYRVSLQAGQVIQLQVVDYEGFDVGTIYEGDLDLYLYNFSSRKLITYSDSITEYEEIIVPEDGEYLVNVWAYSGISKYVLNILPPGARAFAAASDSPQSSDFIAHEMIVQWRDSVIQAVTAQKQNGLSLSHRDSNRPALLKMPTETLEFSRKGLQKKSRPQGTQALDLMRQLNAETYDQLVTLRNIKTVRLQEGVGFAEPNYRRHTQLLPNDPGYRNQWHYPAIYLPQAWDITTGQRPSGQEVIVAVIDTGVYLAHPDLAGQLIGGYDFIANPANARDGDGIDANADDPGDSDQRGQSSWHGTHVAGTIAASSNNNIGLTGIAWGAKLMPIRVLGQNGGSGYDVIQGVRYAAGLSNDSGTVPPRRADVINLSLGGSGGSLAESEAYAAARRAGVIIVAAAGNESSSTPSYPAAYESVISVSATDFANQLAPYSNFGGTIALAAPGGNMRVDGNGDGYADGVLSTVADDTSGSRVAGYSFSQGTSMAAPHVAGIMALMKSVYPALTPEVVDQLIRTGEITDDLGTPGRDNQFGYGRINALKAVRVASALAAGSSVPQWPAQLIATPSSINLGLAAMANITLSNQGGGSPAITSVAANFPWLTVAAVNTTTNGLGTYRLTANRSNLEPGYHQAQVTFTGAEGETIVVNVNMQVGAVSSQGELTQLYVLLLDPETSEALYQTEPDANLRYTFANVPVGEYIVIAGSDIDVDYLICQSGESCGAYPSLARRQPVIVQGESLTGLDFVADILGHFSVAEAAALGAPKVNSGVPRLPETKSPDRSRRVE